MKSLTPRSPKLGHNIKKYSSYLKENTMRLHYKAQLFNSVQ
jgi:hypothetical protein